MSTFSNDDGMELLSQKNKTENLQFISPADLNSNDYAVVQGGTLEAQHNVEEQEALISGGYIGAMAGYIRKSSHPVAAGFRLLFKVFYSLSV